MTPKVLVVIPARGGSKSIPDKNLVALGGKPLITYTIDVAQAVETVDRLIVSTDSERIADVARSYRAEVPFLRPAELAQDETPGINPLIHAVQWLQENEGYEADYLLCLQPTSPLCSKEDVEHAIDVAVRRGADAVVSVAPVQHHPYRMKTVDPEGRMNDFVPVADTAARRQDLPPVYALNGAIYLIRHKVLVTRQTWQTDQTYAVVMPPERSIDIDTYLDLMLAECLLKRGGVKEVTGP